MRQDDEGGGTRPLRRAVQGASTPISAMARTDNWERKGRGMWERAAWHVAALAGELDVALDADAMALCDVRDLLALRACLRYHLRQGARRRLWPGRRHPACARAHTLLRACTRATGTWARLRSLVGHRRPPATHAPFID